MKDRHLRVVTDLESRPDLRHVRRGDVVVYRVRVDIDDADPPIWRRIELRSDVTLDLLHQVLQVAFDWTDSHLHRFSLGGAAFDRHSQLFLCPYDVGAADFDGEDDVPAAETRLDETLSATGDVLHYLYDYGDIWELTVRVEQVLPADSGCPAAVVVDGERAAPPENCGHLVDATSLAEVLPDPVLFEPDRINKAFDGAYFVLAALWEHLAGRMVPESGEKFQTQASLLTLAFAAASADAELPLGRIAALLTELGWRHEDGRAVSESAVRRLPVYGVLTDVTDQPVGWRRRDNVSPAAAAVAIGHHVLDAMDDEC